MRGGAGLSFQTQSDYSLTVHHDLTQQENTVRSASLYWVLRGVCVFHSFTWNTF